ncbi:unnamed protein product [Lactuca virosa]|uniref:Uncharacterized protein n=1 Tax=Lactuca virosa TaxID=75947 RepID=A0AAU9MVM2_9ASTR|nr:unnamed protein product [Lactuca virosa]
MTCVVGIGVITIAPHSCSVCSYAPGSIPFDGYGFCGLRHVSDHHDARCPHCDGLMNVPMTFFRWPSNEEATVKETVTYMVMDDLLVKPMSTITSITHINNYGVKGFEPA